MTPHTELSSQRDSLWRTLSPLSLALSVGTLLMACGGGSGDAPSASSPAPAPAPSAPPPSAPPASAAQLTITTTVSGMGSISPASASVASGANASFTLTPASGQQIVSASGCGGSLSGSTYTTATVTTNCTVSAVFSGATASEGFGPQSSTFAADNGFDFAETFDGLRDWGPDLSNAGSVGEMPGDAALMPRLADGSPSAWTYYSKWGTSTDTTPWIGAFGDNRVWRGTKSAAIDLANKKGPSRLGLLTRKPYKGNLHYFFMVNIPRNEFPTSIPSPATLPATYTAGQPYAWFASWKFMTFNYGCGSLSCWDGAGAGYSPVFHMINHIKQFGYSTYSPLGLSGVTPGLFLNQEAPGGESSLYAITEEGKAPLNDRLGDWFGIEFQLIQNANGTVTRNLWIYDRHGNAVQQMSGQTWTVQGYSAELGWDFFFHGGNNSNTYQWGPTMESVYYIDDIVIDDERIGPRYFRAIGVTPR